MFKEHGDMLGKSRQCFCLSLLPDADAGVRFGGRESCGVLWCGLWGSAPAAGPLGSAPAAGPLGSAPAARRTFGTGPPTRDKTERDGGGGLRGTSRCGGGSISTIVPSRLFHFLNR